MDALTLYRWAVQDPETHAVVLGTMYDRMRSGRQPRILREDFAGTSADSVAWVALQRGRRAIAVDIDATTLTWARQRAERMLGPRAGDIEFVQGDVRVIQPPEITAADIISALNYSVLYFRKEEDLLVWLRNARRGLADNGVLVFNLFGGPESVRVGTHRRQVVPRPRLSSEQSIPEFEYTWEVRSYDPVTQFIDCRIHFHCQDADLPDGKREIPDAFQYPWRLWPADELLSACEQAGFSKVELWRHTYDPAQGEAGVFLGSVDPESLSELEKWTAYIVAG